MMRRLLLLMVLVFATPASGAPKVAKGASGAPKVAVLYFDNVGNPELDMLRLGLAEMMIVDLSNRPDLAVVERNRINQVLGELDLQTSEKFDPSKAVEIGKLLGADRMVLGSYFELLGTLTMTASVVEVETGQSIGGHKVQGKVSEFSGLLDQVTGGVTPALVHGREWLAAAETSKDEDPPIVVRSSGGGATQRGEVRGAPSRTSGPSDTATASREDSESSAAAMPAPGPPADPLGAAMAFSEGLDYLDRKDLKRARSALERAVNLDPNLDVAREELSRIQI